MMALTDQMKAGDGQVLMGLHPMRGSGGIVLELDAQGVGLVVMGPR